MTVFNTPIELVKRAIDSVLQQDFQQFELIVVDDGSTGPLSEQILRYCQIHQSKLTYLRHSNCGQSASIRQGIQLSRGAYVAIIDSDDEYKPNHLSSCLSEMGYADLVSSLTETIVNSRADYYVPDKHNLQRDIHVDDCIPFATLFGRKEVFSAVGFKNNYAADSDFYEEAALTYRVKKVSRRTYVYYRNISASITAKLKEQQFLLA